MEKLEHTKYYHNIHEIDDLEDLKIVKKLLV